jgi:hypothetical protein
VAPNVFHGIAYTKAKSSTEGLTNIVVGS